MRMLARGGNAVDAGVAATFAAAVTEISHFGLGARSRSSCSSPTAARSSSSTARVRRRWPPHRIFQGQRRHSHERSSRAPFPRSSMRSPWPCRVRDAVLGRRAGPCDRAGRRISLVRLPYLLLHVRELEAVNAFPAAHASIFRGRGDAFPPSAACSGSPSWRGPCGRWPRRSSDTVTGAQGRHLCGARPLLQGDIGQRIARAVAGGGRAPDGGDLARTGDGSSRRPARRFGRGTATSRSSRPASGARDRCCCRRSPSCTASTSSGWAKLDRVRPHGDRGAQAGAGRPRRFLWRSRLSPRFPRRPPGGALRGRAAHPHRPDGADNQVRPGDPWKFEPRGATRAVARPATRVAGPPATRSATVTRHDDASMSPTRPGISSRPHRPPAGSSAACSSRETPASRSETGCRPSC